MVYHRILNTVSFDHFPKHGWSWVSLGNFTRRKGKEGLGNRKERALDQAGCGCLRSIWVEIIFSDGGRAIAEKTCSLFQNISGHASHLLPGLLRVTETTRSAEYPSQENTVQWKKVKNNLCSSDFPSKPPFTFQRPRMNVLVRLL